jgi:alkylation response protein AidB-like acyl-CoA dehydrogenase
MEFAGLSYSQEQIELLEVATNFCRDRAPMLSVRAVMESDSGFDPAIWQEMVDLGWLAIAIPEEYAGVGLSLAEAVPVVEQMGRNMLASPFVGTTVAAQAILAGGTEAQRSDWLPKLASGSIAALALYGPDGDWDLNHITATATRNSDRITLSGQKNFVLWADHADLILISVMLDGQPALLLADKADMPASALRREQIIDETRRSFALVLDGLSLPLDAVMDVAKAKPTLAAIELASTLLQSAEMCGGTQTVIDYTLEYLRTRKQFGNVIGAYQALKHPIVDAYVDYEKLRSHLYSAASSYSDQGQGEIAVRMAKAAADRAYSHTADRAVQFHGGFGFTHDCDAGLHRRAAIFQSSQFGDAAWQRRKLAGLLLA